MAATPSIWPETIALCRVIARTWWADVYSYIPGPVLKFFEATPESVVIRVTKERLAVSPEGQSELSKSSEILSWRDKGDDIANCLKEALEPNSKGQPDVSIVLDPEMVLVRRLTYPLLAEPSLGRLFLGQLDALTPWPSEDAWVGWRVVERRLGARQIDVELHVTPKKQLEVLVEAVRNATGGKFSISVEGDLSDGRCALHGLETNRMEPGLRRRRILDFAIFGLPILLAALIIYVPLELDEKYVMALKSETQALRADVDGSIAVGKSVSDLTREYAALHQQRDENRPVIEVLNLLSAALEDDVWLDHLVVSGSKVELSGSAVDAYAMVAILQGGEDVKDVRLKSPIVKGKPDGHQRFQIEVQLEGPE